MNKGKQFLIPKDESSDSEEPAEGWKANNHGPPPPLSVLLTLFVISKPCHRIHSGGL